MPVVYHLRLSGSWRSRVADIRGLPGGVLYHGIDVRTGSPKIKLEETISPMVEAVFN